MFGNPFPETEEKPPRSRGKRIRDYLVTTSVTTIVFLIFCDRLVNDSFFYIINIFEVTASEHSYLKIDTDLTMEMSDEYR